MDDETKVNSVAEDDWGIDLSDVDFSDESETDGAEDTSLDSGDADQRNRTEGGADTEDGENGDGGGKNQLTLKYLGETKTVSRNEAITLAQKGMDYDRIRQKFDELTMAHGMLTTDKNKNDERLSAINELAKSDGYKSADDFLDNMQAAKISEQQGIDKGLALERIKLERERREFKAQADAENSTEALAKKAEDKRKNDFDEFASEYRSVDPDKVSKEVWDTYRQGNCTLVQAYIKHENALLKAKLEADKKTFENRERSAGSRASVGKTALKDKEDELWYSN